MDSDEVCPRWRPSLAIDALVLMVGRQWLRRLPRGFSQEFDTCLRNNLSYVLHDHSRSEFVRKTAIACQQHARSLPKSVPVGLFSVNRQLQSLDSWLPVQTRRLDYVISVQVGLPHLLEDKLHELGLQAPIIFSDAPRYTGETLHLFNAPARLGLPLSTPVRVRVSSLILRPGNMNAQLDLSQEFKLPEDTGDVIRKIEGVIRGNNAQWILKDQLWAEPAEVMLEREIYPPEGGTGGNSDASRIWY